MEDEYGNKVFITYCKRCNLIGTVLQKTLVKLIEHYGEFRCCRCRGDLTLFENFRDFKRRTGLYEFENFRDFKRLNCRQD